jgi:hypothetical protein
MFNGNFKEIVEKKEETRQKMEESLARINFRDVYHTRGAVIR